MLNQETELRKEEIRRILESNPKWITRISIIVLILVIAIILFISFYIKYPVLISSRLTTVYSETQKEYKGIILIKKSDVWTIKREQKVRIKFDRYYKNEYGIVEGTVESINFSRDSTNGYIVYVEFNKSNRTNTGKLVELNKDMQGDAEVIVKEEPLFQKLLRSINIIPSL